MQLSRFFFLIFFAVFISCSRYPDDVEYALELAGKNRIELEKVLKRYNRQPNDSLRYRAACFLIGNMPGHFSRSSALMDTFRYRIYDIAIAHEGKMRPTAVFESQYGKLPGNMQCIYDINVISSDFLIDNIESSFKIWQEAPWGKHVPFNRFCEEILPYRIGDEPLENWKKSYRQAFLPTLDSLQQKNDPVAACSLLYRHIHHHKWLGQIYINAPRLGALTILRSYYGSCRELADIYVYALRSIGIPAGVDMLIQTPDQSYRTHYWAYMRDTCGTTIPFDHHELAPAREKKSIKRKRGKVYRENFGMQANSIVAKFVNINIPIHLSSIFMSDVSYEYDMNAEINVNTGLNRKESELFLGVFNNKEWIPITCSKLENGKAVFPHLENNIVYCPIYDNNGIFLQAAEPIIIDSLGNCISMIPNTETKQRITIDRKYPFSASYNQFYRKWPVGGKFQGANRVDFSDAVTLYTIREEANMKYCTVKIQTVQKFRYIRYLSAPDAYCNMAEISFMSSGKELSGKIIGTDGSYMDWNDRKKFVVFDKDPLTYFHAKEPSGSWVGLDLDNTARIDSIIYLFRNDDNSVRSGELYELFYFSSSGLVSLGSQVGDERQFLVFENVPVNGLYTLRNHTKGDEERPFTYENNKQIWW